MKSIAVFCSSKNGNDELYAVHARQIGELLVVADMHVRKRKMYELCSAAIILPGGFGTMDELFEILTWNQLAIHDLPVFILNTLGFYTDLFQMMQVMQMRDFLREPLTKNVQIFDVPETLMEKLAERILADNL